ncbi:S-layer homology domain-containing protein [uncultured Pseudoflavonifractor sp.]|uniref:S-layer homology domain-containing protein n=1 Tax=uncultured Pseudoflavonifractor sp. TaxID=1221379 RepID=UPI0025CEF164|nr:S-layer homology domain-containing protein [uncultured Pseudoflavonifractor sp.]
MQYTPHNYQAYCIQRVVEDPAIGLFLRPGLGKTVITLSAVNILKYFRWQVAKALVVAPKKVAEATWSKEAAKWDHLQHLRVSTVLGSASKRIKALNTPADVYVTNRENFEWLVDYYQQAWPFDMVIFDESTSFKNSQSKRFKAAKRIRRFIKKVVLLTGTPSSKGLIDLWAQVYLLDGGERLGPSLSAYRERYFDPDKTFTDVVTGDWFAGSVQFVASRELFSGVGNGDFAPYEAMTRSMLVTVLHRLEGSPAPGGASGFQDVPKGCWYSAAADWAAEQGITSGTASSRFDPDAPITRETLALMLYRCAGSPAVASTGKVEGFQDGEQTSAWAREAMEWACANGILGGDANGQLRPQDNSTRAEVATMLTRFVALTTL